MSPEVCPRAVSRLVSEKHYKRTAAFKVVLVRTGDRMCAYSVNKFIRLRHICIWKYAFVKKCLLSLALNSSNQYFSGKYIAGSVLRSLTVLIRKNEGSTECFGFSDRQRKER